MKARAISRSLLPGKFIDEHIKTAGPIDYLQQILNSSFVLTDSFHGVVFCLIFKKPFLVISHGYNLNRIESLLKIVGLEDRIIKNQKVLDDFINRGCDLTKILTYDEVKLAEFISDSKGYIERVLYCDA